MSNTPLHQSSNTQSVPSQKHNKPKKYTQSYFNRPFPPNHNPLIESNRADTLSNISDALYALKELTESPDFGMSQNATTGLHFLMMCVIRAVDFENYHRE